MPRTDDFILTGLHFLAINYPLSISCQHHDNPNILSTGDKSPGPGSPRGKVDPGFIAPKGSAGNPPRSQGIPGATASRTSGGEPRWFVSLWLPSNAAQNFSPRDREGSTEAMYQRPRRVYRRRQHRVYATSRETAPGLLWEPGRPRRICHRNPQTASWKPGDRAGSTFDIRRRRASPSGA